jgi:hypothetical protein
MSSGIFSCRAYAGLCFLAVILTGAAFKPWVHGIDGAGYYSWLRSFVIEGNLETYNEITHFESMQQPDIQAKIWTVRMPWLNGNRLANYYPIGSAVLWSPFFLASHCIVLLANAVGLSVSADGYSRPYILGSMFGSVVWAFAGLSIIYHIAAGRFGRHTAGLATATIWLATPLVYYMYIHPSMSHANDVFVNALFILVWLTTRKKKTWGWWFALGLVAGLAAMVRTQNGLLLVFPCFELALLMVETLRKKIPMSVRCILGRGIALTGGAAAAFLPQMLVWKAVFGSYIVLNAQKASVGLGFDWTCRNILNVLISSDRGLLIWSPIVVPGLFGIFLLSRSDRRFAAMLFCSFALQLYVVGSWAAWSGGVSFGQRFFLNSVPAFSIGLAALLAVVKKRVWPPALAIVCGVFTLWNLGLMAQYVLQLIPRAGTVSLGSMVSNQFCIVPGKILGLLLRALART